VAQRLQKRHSDTIGLILLPTALVFRSFFSEFLAGVGNMAAEHGYDLLVSLKRPMIASCKSTARKCKAGRWTVLSSCVHDDKTRESTA
jgi:DNA-binding LacI/PurR family transcriptional regulator